MTMSQTTCTEGHDPSFLIDSTFSADAGFRPKSVYRNLSPPKLYEKALAYEPNTHITSSGALVTTTGSKTGRSPRDKRVVRESGYEADVWWGPNSPNYEMDEQTFLMNREAAVDYLSTVDRVYVVDGYANWDPECRTKIRVICSREHHALFAYNMLIRPSQQELMTFEEPDFVIWNAGAYPANRYNPFMSSRTSIATSLKHKQVVILGTEYAGEMKKGVFTLLHYYMPQQDVLFLHSGCNIGKAGDVTLFFGLSGTGKTTLSSDPDRPLIGDDEHCWGPNGVFNIEAGCYAKCINLSAADDHDIYAAVNRFGTLLENVVYDEDEHEVDYTNTSLTENMRACFPMTHMHNAHIPCVGGHPRNVISLCCDALGVLPPVSQLTVEQAMYHFISGYTAKIAGTEVGVCCPEPTFSPCYAGAFIMWHPVRYAALLGNKLRQAGTHVWLVNTGWQGGKASVGQRISLKHTRAIINAIHRGDLETVQYEKVPVFGLQVPSTCPGVPAELLHPENQWQDKREFTATITRLAAMFRENFEIFMEEGVQVGGEHTMMQILNGGPEHPQQQQQQQQGLVLAGSGSASSRDIDKNLLQRSEQHHNLSSKQQPEVHEQQHKQEPVFPCSMSSGHVAGSSQATHLNAAGPGPPTSGVTAHSLHSPSCSSDELDLHVHLSEVAPAVNVSSGLPFLTGSKKPVRAVDGAQVAMAPASYSSPEQQ